jgi:hypothetical protein
MVHSRTRYGIREERVKTIRQMMVALFFSLVAMPMAWGVMETPGSRHDVAPSQQISSGFFGGIHKGQKLMLILSEKGGVRYYHTDRQLLVIRRGARIDIGSLPLKTPIVVHSDSGRAVEVDVLEVGR